jgi:anti-sigma regulatory factor (Ser/Thr protein kinase)
MTPGEPVASRRFEATPASVAGARAFARDTVARARGSEPEHLALLVSELASNAVVHACSPFTVTVRLLDDDVVRVEVHDDDPLVPALRDPAADATTGRGLRVVESLSDRWGCDVDPDGKIVWFEQRTTVDQRA